MGVICFTSLKGGVGKTSLSVNVAHAFAERGCEVLIIDCDPSAHASRLLLGDLSADDSLARFLASLDLDSFSKGRVSLTELAAARGLQLFTRVREGLYLTRASHELRHFSWGQAARVFRRAFPVLMAELLNDFDYVIIDTNPEFNVVLRNCLAVADLAVVPVDACEMSIHSLEELLSITSHIKRPTWAIARTMVNQQASRLRALSDERLKRNISPHAIAAGSREWSEDGEEFMGGADEFLRDVRKRSGGRNGVEHGESGRSASAGIDSTSPVFLLNSFIPRSEFQNRLSFLGRTSFDRRDTARLAVAYSQVARELEYLLTMLSRDESPELGAEAPAAGLM